MKVPSMAQQKYEVKEPPITIDVEQPSLLRHFSKHSFPGPLPSNLATQVEPQKTELPATTWLPVCRLAVKEEEEKEEERKKESLPAPRSPEQRIKMAPTGYVRWHCLWET